MKLSSNFRLICSLSLGLVGAFANAALFYGQDIGIGESNPRPNSNAAQSAFALATVSIGPMITENFESQSIGYSPSINLANGVTLDLSEISGDYGISNNSGSPSLGFNTTGGGDNHLRLYPFMTVALSSATFNFDVPISAFGLYLTGVGSGGPGTVRMQWNDGVAHSEAILGNAAGGCEFFGFTGPETVSSVTIFLDHNNDVFIDSFSVDDIQFARTAAVPEPASLCVLALGAFGMIRRRKSRN